MSLELAPSAAVAKDESNYERYRALSSMAVASCVLGALSSVNLLSYEYGLALGVIPIVALVLGLRANWMIGKFSGEYTGRGLARAGMVLALGFLLAGWGISGFVYATEVPDGYQRVTYRQLQPHRKEPHKLPAEALELDGKRVFIKGYVYPGQAQTKGIKTFVLCRDNGDCCFGGNPPLTDKILVTLRDPLRLEYSSRVQRLAGTFRVEPGMAVDAPGQVVYQLDADYLQQ